MQCGFVVQAKRSTVWLNRGLSLYFNLYAPDFQKVYFYLLLLRPIFSTKSMHTDFVVWGKCTIVWLNRGLREYFDLYEPDFEKVPKINFPPLLLGLFIPLRLHISMHTDFVVHAKCTIPCLNVGYILKCMCHLFQE